MIEFKLRDGDTHRRQCNEWNNLETPKERGDFFTKYGARWTELARLPYLDLVRCTVVDPMHNLLLGIVKNQWYGQWILQGALRKATTTHGRELDVIHQFLESFESPLWAGKLPLRVGEPAGGSLSADEYKLAAITVLPIIIPIVWDMYSEEANVDFQKAKLKWEDDKKEYEMAMALWESNAHQDAETGEIQTGKKRKADGQPVPPKKPKVRMQDGEARNFLRLATALKILLSSSIDDEQLERAQILLEEYLLGFKELYGESAMKPNQAWAVHIVDQIRDFGPVYSFWTFVSERLNKLLKNFNSNGLKGGQMEISMMRSFGREKQLRTMVYVPFRVLHGLTSTSSFSS
ncbi:hypothetical protein BD410DRAFT_734964 [Rickenella mellea]|uniref:Uncharacterized protein n=1 Tax=Rickenella mellea TaxID=50990 RepID=A0A4Y7PGQ3_9AGAM|nr:hypothetical protein BD410DRAFT_734964 [Rickenella mellea]